MPYLLQLPSGAWSAQIDRMGVRASKSFPTKAAAKAWATQTEGEILARQRGQVVRKTLRDALERYAADVTPKKKGRRWETVRIAAFLEYGLPFADKWLEDVKPDDFARWRDLRLKGVKASTVNRDWNLLAHVLTTARDEWGWLTKNPLDKVQRPRNPQPRKRVVTWREVRAMLRMLGWSRRTPETLQQQVGYAILMALHTAMRASEVLGAEYRGGVAYLADSKNGEAREVPLSARAQRLAKLVTFTITSATLDALFRKARNRAGLAGFTYHDLRASALTRLSRHVDVLTLAKISGHRDLGILSRVYYRETAGQIGARLR